MVRIGLVFVKFWPISGEYHIDYINREGRKREWVKEKERKSERKRERKRM